MPYCITPLKVGYLKTKQRRNYVKRSKSGTIGGKSDKRSKIGEFPRPLFASVMGLSGLTIAWYKGHEVLNLPSEISDGLRYLTTLIWLLLFVIYLFKGIRFPQQVKADSMHPIKMNFLTAISIGLLLLSVAWKPASIAVSQSLWMVGAILHLGFTFFVVDRWIFKSQFKLAQITPAWFIPVVGNIIVPVVGVNYAPSDVNWFFFSIGFLFWIVLLTLVLHRMFFADPLPTKLNPTLFVLIAPPAVGFISYTKLVGELVPFGQILYFFAMFWTLFLALKVRVFLNTPFFLSAWGYSFPLAAFSIASLEMSGLANIETALYYRIIGSVMLIISTLIITYLTVRTLREIINGSVFQPD
ncbi:SLAC1 anion channel family protein [Actinobacillus pleuropneumoniae]|uniref:SLAC1 anion channel family protein n=2 Tax=Actinobacillus pleuropneumoniae TaxID=715 RepID=UPI001F164A2E|nr:SLAC1 anion channel family protein [Actinobacillus pleuropneumoniae]MCL7709152.1 SLAC1 anion channel family protein [Actinobacillus pleuropneumoniae]MCL7711435.1 SLAC1 anion channel family protein [Actinobacillus pleuropneumoniae]MCL7717405.1 SLAC1 anion channel family protein [Actinobacillus pleuropneumoniae]MCL7722317.1 SLAC1 anion channel family protein [Actinobacillus pleuropneumoniae]MCL7732306.1 SLAC1 anion channel family protein [Actinobacillus pleuropneumoniae]